MRICLYPMPTLWGNIPFNCNVTQWILYHNGIISGKNMDIKIIHEWIKPLYGSLVKLIITCIDLCCMYTKAFIAVRHNCIIQTYTTADIVYLIMGKCATHAKQMFYKHLSETF